jgi:hypothetical protein
MAEGRMAEGRMAGAPRTNCRPDASSGTAGARPSELVEGTLGEDAVLRLRGVTPIEALGAERGRVPDSYLRPSAAIP